jgi:ATP-dependent Zn protease
MSGGARGLLPLDPAMRRFFSYVRPYGWWVAGATIFGLLKFNIPVFNEISTGASDDLQKASRLAREMLTVYGMSKKLPNLVLAHDGGDRFLGRGPSQGSYSEKLEQMIDEEVLEILGESYEHDKKLLEAKRDKLEEMAQLLQEKEKIDEEDLGRILGPRPQENGELGFLV